MTTYAKIKSDCLIFEPIVPSEAPNGSIYLDHNNSDIFTNKTIGGIPQPVSSSSDLFTKSKKNMSGVSIPINTAVALVTDGTIVIADADEFGTRRVIGITKQEIPDGTFGNILLTGPNVSSILVDSGFAPGDPVYMSKVTGGFVNETSSFDIETDTIVQIGYADCESGVASSVVRDLILDVNVISTPS
jgi:hypothetical protein